MPQDAPSISIAPKVISLDPVTRIEGHLKIMVQARPAAGRKLEVRDAWSTGTMFRGIEMILTGRDPWDAVPITQRICGVCPVSHGLAASQAIESASGVNPPTNARVLRNLVLGANYIQSHILHFYHLALLDYVDGPEMAPWEPAWRVDRRIDANKSKELLQHYVAALEARRKAHEMGAVFGGRLPHPPTFVPGGFTSNPNSTRTTKFKAYLDDLTTFVENVYIPDVEALASVYADYFEIGRSNGNLLAFGVFDLDDSGQTKLLQRGRVEQGADTVLPVDTQQITEHVTRSWYRQDTNDLPPESGTTVAEYPKEQAYSWLKAPRYAQQAYEVGPLARMWISNEYRHGISVMDRHLARAKETLKIAKAMQTWLSELKSGRSVYTDNKPPDNATGTGLTEAARGALGHWMQIKDGKIARYQVITPTCWNASPRDSAGVRGPIEQALLHTLIADANQPIELLRVVHSFDPCLACAVHVIRPENGDEVVVESRWSRAALATRS